MERAGPEPDVTTLLGKARNSRDAQEALFRLVEAELHSRAERLLRKEPCGNSLQPTMLVDDAFQKLIRNEATWEDRSHFYRVASEVMRKLLIDWARRRAADKRGSKTQVLPIDSVPEPADRIGLDPTTLLALHEALDRLALVHPDLAQMVQLRYFCGCSIPRLAGLLGQSEKTIQRHWQIAKAYLHRDMSGDPHAASRISGKS